MGVGKVLTQETDDIVHVSPTGDDRAAGTLNAPIATVGRALQWLVKRRRSVPDRDLIVQVHAGCYRIDRPILVGPSHCGRGGAKTIIRGEGRDRTIVTGSAAAVPKLLADTGGATPVHAGYSVFAVDLPFNKAVPLDLGTLGFALRQPLSPPALFVDGSRLPWSRWPATPNLVARMAPDADRSHKLALAVASDVLVGVRSDEDLWIEMVVDQPWRWFMGRVTNIDFQSGIISTSLPAEIGEVGQRVFQVGFRNGRSALEPGCAVLDTKQRRILFLAKRDDSLGGSRVELCDNPRPLFYLVDATDVELSDFRLYGGLASGISIERGKNIEIRCIDAHGFSFGGIDASGTSISISDCQIRGVGTSGIVLRAGEPASLEPGLSCISNCQIHGWAHWRKVYEPAIRLAGVGIRVSGCQLHDGPHMAIELAGNDHVIAGNTFTRVARDFADIGAIYVNAGNRPLERGTVIVGNVFYDIGRNPLNNAVYVDRASCGVSVVQNLFFNIGGAGGAAVYANGPSDLLVKGNLFVDCPIAVVLNFYLADWGKRDLEEMQAAWALAISRLGDPALPHHAAYPELARFALEDRVYPPSNRVTHNVALDLSGVTDPSGALQVHYGPIKLVDMAGNQVLKNPDALSMPFSPVAGLIAGMTAEQALSAIVHACENWPAVSAALQLEIPSDR
jgi:hypothetical protein